MSRYPTPEGNFRWDDARYLPRIGELFFEVADDLEGEQVSRELDSLPTGKTETGLIKTAVIPKNHGIEDMPLIVIRSLAANARIPDYKATAETKKVERQVNRQNAALVSQMLGAVSLNIYEDLMMPGLPTFEELRGYYVNAYDRLDDAYFSGINPDFRPTSFNVLHRFERAGVIIAGPQLATRTTGRRRSL